MRLPFHRGLRSSIRKLLLASRRKTVERGLMKWEMTRMVRATLYFEVKIKGLLMNLIWGRE